MQIPGGVLAEIPIRNRFDVDIQRLVVKIGKRIIDRDFSKFESRDPPLATDFQAYVGDFSFHFLPSFDAQPQRVSVITTAQTAITG